MIKEELVASVTLVSLEKRVSDYLVSMTQLYIKIEIIIKIYKL
jgi:hypothetical protein